MSDPPLFLLSFYVGKQRWIFMHIRSISFHLFINYLCRCPKVHGPQDTGLLRALHSRNPKNIRNPLIFLQKMASYSCFWRVPS